MGRAVLPPGLVGIAWGRTDMRRSLRLGNWYINVRQSAAVVRGVVSLAL